MSQGCSRLKIYVAPSTSPYLLFFKYAEQGSQIGAAPSRSPGVRSCVCSLEPSEESCHEDVWIFLIMVSCLVTPIS